MKLLIKQRIFSWTDSYDIYDESGEAKYYVKADFLAWGHVLRVYDKSGNEIGVVKEKVISFLPKFEIEMGGSLRGTIEREFTFFKPKYDVDFNGWHIEGDVWGWNYDVYSGCNSIIKINKELFHWGDTYVIGFANPQDELMGLMLVIAIDAANCSQSSNC